MPPAIRAFPFGGGRAGAAAGRARPDDIENPLRVIRMPNAGPAVPPGRHLC
jgi:hypothetical protein